jgi:hypothetical protein
MLSFFFPTWSSIHSHREEVFNPVSASCCGFKMCSLSLRLECEHAFYTKKWASQEAAVSLKAPIHSVVDKKEWILHEFFYSSSLMAIGIPWKLGDIRKRCLVGLLFLLRCIQCRDRGSVLDSKGYDFFRFVIFSNFHWWPDCSNCLSHPSFLVRSCLQSLFFEVKRARFWWLWLSNFVPDTIFAKTTRISVSSQRTRTASSIWQKKGRRETGISACKTCLLLRDTLS